jgi:hypothetical protein
MRLHRHDEIVEAMARARQAMLESRWEDLDEDDQRDAIDGARIALDAMLEAVVRLEVGEDVPNGVPYPFLILKLEPKP